jgi:hypothetical protein
MVVMPKETWQDKAGSVAVRGLVFLFWGLLGFWVLVNLLAAAFTRETIAYGVADIMPGRFKADISQVMRGLTVPVGLIEAGTGWRRNDVTTELAFEECPRAFGGSAFKDRAKCLSEKSDRLPFTDFGRTNTVAVIYTGKCTVGLEAGDSPYRPLVLEVWGEPKGKFMDGGKYGVAIREDWGFGGNVAIDGKRQELFLFDQEFCDYWAGHRGLVNWRVHRMYGVRD